LRYPPRATGAMSLTPPPIGCHSSAIVILWPAACKSHRPRPSGFRTDRGGPAPGRRCYSRRLVSLPLAPRVRRRLAQPRTGSPHSDCGRQGDLLFGRQGADGSAPGTEALEWMDHPAHDSRKFAPAIDAVAPQVGAEVGAWGGARRRIAARAYLPAQDRRESLLSIGPPTQGNGPV
jgi:hypothetical protein